MKQELKVQCQEYQGQDRETRTVTQWMGQSSAPPIINGSWSLRIRSRTTTGEAITITVAEIYSQEAHLPPFEEDTHTLRSTTEGKTAQAQDKEDQMRGWDRVTITISNKVNTTTSMNQASKTITMRLTTNREAEAERGGASRQISITVRDLGTDPRSLIEGSHSLEQYWNVQNSMQQMHWSNIVETRQRK